MRTTLALATAGLLWIAFSVASAQEAKAPTASGGDARPEATGEDPGVEEQDPKVKEVQDCVERNIPESSSEQTVEMTAFDRVGGKRLMRAKIYAKQLDEGDRRMKVKFSRPLDMRGSELLTIETDTAPDTFLYTPEMRKVKRVSSHGGGGSVFGTDFSYEDFERWQLFNRPGASERLPDDVIEGRPVYVLSTVPAKEAESEYEKIVSFIDKETCVTLKSESYERGDRLRKVLTAKVGSLMSESGIWIATEVRMDDVLDETYTEVVVEDLEIDGDLSDAKFQISRMGHGRD